LNGLNKDGGISFERKTNFGKKKEEPKVEESEIIEEPKVDEEYLARQARLTAKLKTAKVVNYSGFAVNGSSILALLFGIHHFIMDPNTLELINLIETTFGVDIPYEQFIEIVELWKAQIMSLCGSIQLFFMYYQQTRQRMKNSDTEDLWGFINEEFEKL
tara:strand:+ start:238 stop:714 length:477 start_codon:yes stop_codon:yes gene_type:complete